jgi:hypothetical protein
MAVVNLTATRRGVKAAGGKGEGPSMKVAVATVEVGSADSATSTYTMFRIPSNARILGPSTLYADDLASTGSPTIDIGLFSVDGNITSDDDAIRADIDVATAAANTRVISDVANLGKQAWEFVSGQTSDPGGVFEVKLTLKDAAVNVGGTLTLELYYAID